jgi:trehalose 6-phosphate phosphatase
MAREEVDMTKAAEATYGGFFQRLKAASKRVLVLDYDGTIAPFHKERHRATPYPEVPDLLCSIMQSCRTRLIVVSGRTAREVPPLLGVHPAPEIWGTYGIEKIHSDGRYEEAPISDAALQILAQAEAELDQEGLSEQIEFKLAGVALHWRGLSAAEVLRIRTKAFRILEPLAKQPDVVLSDFEGGVEIRLLAANKGDTLRDLLSELDSNVPVAYLGDDITDEDAFRVLNGRGLTVRVAPKRRCTAAQIWVKPPDEVVRFLTHWIVACGGVQ